MGRPKGKSNTPTSKEDRIAPYFRGIFLSHRKLLKTRSNKAVLKMWLDDHPGVLEVPANVKTGLANVKSVMRSKLHKHRGKQAAAEEATARATGTLAAKPQTSRLLSSDAADSGLEKLEMMIDECMNWARELDSKKLADVIHSLLIARRRVVWKLGEDV